MKAYEHEALTLDALDSLELACGDLHGLAELLGHDNSSVGLKDLERGERIERRRFLWQRLRPLICDRPRGRLV
jgi:hypothetical protein